jgi:hypothetical protein
MSDSDGLDTFWGDLLSEDPERVIAAWVSLAEDEQQSIEAHLRKMATEDGWADVQRQSAQAALDTLNDADS